MKVAVYTRVELLRFFRNRRFFIFSVGFPLVLYFVIAGTNRGEQNLGGSGISAPLYFMVGLVSFGAITAVVASGGRIAVERTIGWIRQLRITPLSSRAYLRTKILTGYISAAVTIVLLYVAGISLGVRLPVLTWLQMTGLILVALVPFAALGILLGHLLSADSIGPAIGGTTALFAFLGGSWFPITGSGVFESIAQLVPSYWLVQASHLSLEGRAWGYKGWLVIAVWTLVLTVVAARAYQHDTKRG